MSSININTSAMAALQTLRHINSGLDKTQEQVSSGLRVGKAADNAAYWSIATTMKSDNKALSAVSDSIGVAKAITDTAYAAVEEVLEHLNAMKALLVTARSLLPAENMDTSSAHGSYVGAGGLYSDADPAYSSTMLKKIDDEMTQHIQAVNSVIDSASFNGVNLLQMPKDGSLTNGSSATYVVSYANGQALTIDISNSDFLIFNPNYAGEGALANRVANYGALLVPAALILHGGVVMALTFVDECVEGQVDGPRFSTNGLQWSARERGVTNLSVRSTPAGRSALQNPRQKTLTNWRNLSESSQR
ncbi:flagellin N-terminal helical domain-containing protein [Rhizobium leguminosarum]